MTEALTHRGPDDSAYFNEGNLGLGFKRLSIIDPEQGNQPFFSPDRSVVCICNGEIFNFPELREELRQKGFSFRSNCDVEVIPMLYQVYGTGFVGKLNGQFAIALADLRNRTLLLVRDHFGICPLYYTQADGRLLFGSEIKALLQYPGVGRQVGLTGLDQVFSFPGLVSPHTMFEGICSLKPGHMLEVGEAVSLRKYWDLDYPRVAQVATPPNLHQCIEQTEDLLLKAVRYRMQADAPVGFYLSGGLDSSLIGAMIGKLNGGASTPSFSVCFASKEDQELNEQEHQQFVARYLGSDNFSVPFDVGNVQARMREVVWFSECPLKETYNACSLALSAEARRRQVKVILSGEGADEFFGGYVGYRFDRLRHKPPGQGSLDDYFERQIRQQLWGDPDFFYEQNHYELKEVKGSIFSAGVNERYADFDCLNSLQVDGDMLAGRDCFHKRSYLDTKLRLADHLLADHCDRMNYANSVEGRYPFLDINLIEYLRTVPAEVKMKNFQEKYLLRQVAGHYLPERIAQREKFSFVAPGSPQLLQHRVGWVQDLLSYDYVKRAGYFDPDVIEQLKQRYQRAGFKLNVPFESDLLLIVLSFHLFLEVFSMPAF
jgi:asparagine synthase (glutamine-hydrolysing)